MCFKVHCACDCRLQLFDLKSKKASIIATEAATASTIVKLRTSIRSAEADQNAAIDVEDFARAESLDASIAEWKSALDAAERKQAGFAREVRARLCVWVCLFYVCFCCSDVLYVLKLFLLFECVYSWKPWMTPLMPCFKRA